MHFPTDDGVVKAVDGLSFALERGQTLGIVGESGSGKSVTSLSASWVCTKARRGRISGEIWLDGQELVGPRRRRCASCAAGQMAMIFQDPLSSMHPFYTVGEQIVEAYRVHHDVSQAGRPQARDRHARPGRHPAAGPAGRRLPAPVLRRHAPAGDDRHGAGQQPDAAHRRRAHHRARRHRAGADPRPDPGPAGASSGRRSSSSPTTSGWWPSWPTTSWSCTAAGASSTARPTTSSPRPSTRTPGACWLHAPARPRAYATGSTRSRARRPA